MHMGKQDLTLIYMNYYSLLAILHCLLWLISLKVRHDSMLVIGAIRHLLTLCALYYIVLNLSFYRLLTPLS